MARELNRRDVESEPGKARLLQTWQEVLRGMGVRGDELVLQNQVELECLHRRLRKH